MADLLLYGTELLTRDGQLTTDVDCCCGVEACPNCCSQITSGALIAGEIKIFITDGLRSLEVTIITPRGDRVVCKGDVVSINLKFT